MLDTTRAYALEKLATSGEQDSIAERHASFSIQMLESNPVNLFDLEFTEAAANAVRDYLGNIRAALEWSFGPNGNDPTAIRLAAAASQLFLAMSLFLECRAWMEKAIDRMTADCDPRHQMKIHAALALSLMYTEGNSERVREAFNTALNFAEQHEDAYLHLSLLSGMSMYLHGIVDAAGSMNLRFVAWPPQGRPEVQTMRPSPIPCWEQHTVCVLTTAGARTSETIIAWVTALPTVQRQPIPVRSSELFA